MDPCACRVDHILHDEDFISCRAIFPETELKVTEVEFVGILQSINYDFAQYSTHVCTNRYTAVVRCQQPASFLE